MTQQLWMWAALLFAMGFFMGGVNNWAHAGGFAGGFVTAQLMPTLDRRRETLPESLAAIALLGLTAVGFVLSFIKVTGLILFH
jgi:membrane associated rhomboid family serine protease